MLDQNLNTALSADEQRELALVLALTPDAPDLVELDGFFHGVLALPEVVMPGQWLPKLLPATSMKTETEVKRLLDLVFRDYNRVATQMLDGKPAPRSDGSAEQCERWMTGFARGITLDPLALSHLSSSDQGSAIGTLIFSYTLGTSALTPSMLASLPKNVRDDLQETREYSQNTFAERSPEDNLEMLGGLATGLRDAFKSSSSKTSRRSGRKTGPNEPCPCGSGQKYKRCCGKPGAA